MHWTFRSQEVVLQRMSQGLSLQTPENPQGMMLVDRSDGFIKQIWESNRGVVDSIARWEWLKSKWSVACVENERKFSLCFRKLTQVCEFATLWKPLWADLEFVFHLRSLQLVLVSDIIIGFVFIYKAVLLSRNPSEASYSTSADTKSSLILCFWGELLLEDDWSRFSLQVLQTVELNPPTPGWDDFPGH